PCDDVAGLDPRSLLSAGLVVRPKRVSCDTPHAVSVPVIDQEAPSRVDDRLAAADRHVSRRVTVALEGVVAADDELLDRLVPSRPERLVVGIDPRAYGGLAHDWLVVRGEEDDVVRQH